MIERPDASAGALLDLAHDAILTVSSDGTIRSWNWGSETMFGHSSEEAVGKNYYTLLVPAQHREEMTKSVQEAIETGSAVLHSSRTRKDGASVDVEILIGVLESTPKGAAVVGVSHRDITDQNRLAEQLYGQNRELEAARRAAEAATRAKADFLSSMSHEIRTPMNAVIGMTSLLLETPLSAEQRDFVETIRTSGDHLLTVLNDILDFSKIESGHMELEQVPFDLRTCIEESLDLVAFRAAQKGLELAYLISPEVPATIVGDSGRLRQVLVNLLSNAVKFTDHGEVVVSVASREVAPRRHEIQVSVKDTGIGVPEDKQARLFQPFTQADASTSRLHGGTGLGLAICRRLTELMGGTIGLESVAGKGSTFRFNILAEAMAVPLRRSVQGLTTRLGHQRVLIVDDNETNRRILSLYAKSWGLLPKEAASGPEALKILDAGDPFDVVLLDQHMPMMNGLDFAREMRKKFSPESLPIIILSSVGLSKDQNIKELGIAAFLTKPIKPSPLYDVLSGVAGRERTMVSEDPRSVRFDPQMAKRHPLRILLAEDNPVNQKVASLMLRRLGYEPDVVSNGLEAVEAVERIPYDVVLLDVEMPQLDGLEAARRICRRFSTGVRPYLVAMTARAMAGDKERCLEAGMDDYMSKPVDLIHLIQALERAPHREGAMSANAPGGPKSA